MKRLLFILSFAFLTVNAQEDANPLKSNNPVIQSMIDEAVNNSQLENLAHELFDVVGPRLGWNTTNAKCSRLGSC